ncbi:MAG: hypothetical protein HY553_19210 [Elusimicrobia bacterium]|nr:hypothetical protein [Elusimicrobiota bacterium]
MTPRSALVWAAAGWLTAAGASAPAAAGLPKGFEVAASLTKERLESFGINPVYIVAVRLADDGRILVAEHRPGAGSVLHVLRPDGGYESKIDVPSPQLADFTVDEQSRVFLVGSLGTRFYWADLEARKATLVLSSLPHRSGFRALPPVSVTRTPDGPAVYGIFYESKDATQDVGFARIGEDGAAAAALSTRGWESRFGQAVSYMPDSRLEAALVVAQEPLKTKQAAPATPAPAPPQRLILVERSGQTKDIDAGDEIFGAAWSPGGSSFAYTRRRGERQELVAASRTMAPFVLATGGYFGAAFANGGKALVVSAREPKGVSLWAMRYPAGSLERIALPEGPCVFTTGPSGKGIAVWGPWGVRTFKVTSG